MSVGTEDVAWHKGYTCMQTRLGDLCDFQVIYHFIHPELTL